LTLSTLSLWALQSWGIDEDRATPSDHAVIVFSWEPLYFRPVEQEKETTSSWDIDKLRANEARLERPEITGKELSSGRQHISDESCCEDVEDKAQWMQGRLTAVLDKHAPPKPSRPGSKRWWTDEIKQERKKFSMSKRALKMEELSFEGYRQIRNGYYHHIRRAKREAWERFFEGVLLTDEEAQNTADSERCWRALRYSKPQTPSYTPAIKTFTDDGQLRSVAASPKEKEEVFMEQAFPRQ